MNADLRAFGNFFSNLFQLKFFFFFFRIIQDNFQHETVHLGFRQTIGTLLFNRVLGSHYQKQAVQFVGVVTDSDLSLLHRFKQSTLHFCRCAVDFIRKDARFEAILYKSMTTSQ